MLSRRERYCQRLEALRAERANWDSTWRDIAAQLIPYRTVWDVTQRNRGDRRDHELLNSRPTLSLKTLAAGMMAGITSPARDWFKLTTSNPDLAEIDAVKEYLDVCQRRIAAALHSSNFYKSLASGVYLDIASVGTAAMFEEESLGDSGLIRFRALPIGEYFLDVDDDGRVDTCFRELAMTVRQLVKKFGRDNVSQAAKSAYDRGNYQHTVTVVHAIQPHDEYDPNLTMEHNSKRWASCWWEVAHESKEQFLAESGYEEFPILAPRWSSLPSDAYGRGPGWDARGDCKELQHHEERLLNLIDLMAQPPMVARGQVKGASLRPGDITHVGQGQDHSYEPAVVVPAGAITAVRERIQDVEARIGEVFFAHLWNMLLSDDRNQRPTATEVEARRQEVMLMLGPLLENMNDELLEPVIERTFAILDRNDQLPLPPEEFEGQEVKVEFISIMHQMQQATGLVSIRTLVNEVRAIAEIRPDVIDKLDADVIADELQRITGVPSDTVLSKDEVAKVRQARAEQEQAKQTGEAMLAATQGVRNLAGVDPTQLSELARAMSPVAAAQGGALGPVGAA